MHQRPHLGKQEPRDDWPLVLAEVTVPPGRGFCRIAGDAAYRLPVMRAERYDKLATKSGYPNFRATSTFPLRRFTTIAGMGMPLNQFFLTMV